MRVLIVKLSSLGDVVHAMPVVHDIVAAHPQATIDWVIEPAFAPALAGLHGLAEVIALPLRRWSRTWWHADVRRQAVAFRERLQRHRYDAVLDLQGLTKSAVVARLARGTSYGLANRTDGASHEWPARWLVDHAIRVEPRIHAIDRSRVLAARALGHALSGPPEFGLIGPAGRAAGVLAGRPTVALIHGTSRDDKLWPEADWIGLGRQAIDEGWQVALPQAGAAEAARAGRIASALGPRAAVWPALDLGGVVGRLRHVQGAVGVDSGLSHIAVALGLPHVQIYNHPTAWRTGPIAAHGHVDQVAVEGAPAPSLQAVLHAWQRVCPHPAA